MTSTVALAANGPTLTVASPVNNANVGLRFILRRPPGGVYFPTAIALDPSYSYFYVVQVNGYSGDPQILSFQYDASSGAGTLLSGPISRPDDNAVAIAVSP